MYADGQYDDEDCITNEGVLIQNQTQAISSSIIAGSFGIIIIITNYDYYGDTEIRVGCRMGGLRQACARTIHGYYILG